MNKLLKPSKQQKELAAGYAVTTGIRREAVARWFASVNITTLRDVRARYPLIEHAAMLRQMQGEIVDFICRVPVR